MFQLPKIPPQQGALAMNIPNPMPTPALMAPMAKPMVTPKKEASVWDKDNRRRTFLAMAQAFGSNKNFFGGLGDAAGNVGSLMDQLSAEKKKKVAAPDLVGPNSSFERRVDPETGAITYEPVIAMHDFMDQRDAVKNKAIEARIEQAERRLDIYGDRSRASTEQGERRTDTYVARANDLTRQGDARIGLSAAKQNAPKAPPSARRGGSKSSGGGGSQVRVINGVVYRRKQK